MSDSPYNKEYIQKIFTQNSELKEKVTLIVNQLQGKESHIKDESYQKDLVEKLILEIGQTILSNLGELKIHKLSPEEEKLFLQQISQMIQAISNKKHENEEEFFQFIIEGISEIYIEVLERGTEKEPDFLNEKDRKRIKEELQRMVEYEIHKKMNPQRLAGETAKENFLNNMQVGGASLAKKYEGKQYMAKISPKELAELNKQHQKFQQDFKVENTSLGQALTPKTPMNKAPKDKNLSKE
jgi:hypothetical protein